MNNHGEVHKGERWEEHRELRDPIGGNTRPLGQTESSYTTINNLLGFDEPLSDHDQQAPAVPSLVRCDAICAEELMDCWIGRKSGLSSSSDEKRPPMPESTQIPPPPPPPSQPTIEISPSVHVRLRRADET
jgi:hypothetical protein